ncbi:hypothetical protein [Saccharothrix syringae]|uniref:Nitroreductase n=1 Tax=Saccharothrix syringae TaxID=103733 RepID=A0A5Q0H1V1_SACSY|nr:hypothetical protein [Saccharothrix syringae]QFZ20236.1 hypothetical protein EKG83_24995 [Saccharothrix syringae]
MERGGRDRGTIGAAVAPARRAPSAHNARPWRWLVGDRGVHLCADPLPPTPRRPVGEVVEGSAGP